MDMFKFFHLLLPSSVLHILHNIYRMYHTYFSPHALIFIPLLNSLSAFKDIFEQHYFFSFYFLTHNKDALIASIYFTISLGFFTIFFMFCVCAFR